MRLRSPVGGAGVTFALPGASPPASAPRRPSSQSVSSQGTLRCPECSGTLALPLRRCARCLGGPGGEAGAGLAKPPSRLGSATRTAVGLPPLTREEQELLAHLRDGCALDLEWIGELLETTPAAATAREATFGWGPLLFAADQGDLELVEMLLEASADLRAACHQGNTALHLASRAGREDVVSLLLERRADLECQNYHGWTPLMWSALAGKRAAADVLLEARACLEHRDLGGRVAAMWAGRHGHAHVLRDLLARGFNPTAEDVEGLTVEDHVFQYESMCSNVPERKPRGVNHLEAAGIYDSSASDGSLDLMRLLKQHGARSIEQEDEEAEAELESPTDVLLDFAYKSECLLAAAENNDWEAVEEELRNGACGWLQLPDLMRSPLMWAAIHNAPAAAMSLVAARAPLEARDGLGWTALRHAVQTGSCEVVSVLHFLGADFRTLCDSGDTLMHLAATADRSEMLQLISPATEGVDVLSEAGFTPLQVAASSGCASALHVLLALRADVTMRDKDERSVFALATLNGHESAVRALVSRAPSLSPLWDEAHVNELLLKLMPPAEDAQEGDAEDDAERPDSGVGRDEQRSKWRQDLQAIKEEEDEEGVAAGEPASRAPTPEKFEERPMSQESQRSVTSHVSTATATSVTSKASARSRGSMASKVSVPGSSKAAGKCKKGKKRKKKKAVDSGPPPSPVLLMRQACTVREADGPVEPSRELFSIVDKNGRLPLAIAVRSRHYALVPVLLEIKAPVDAATASGETALMLAAAQGAGGVATQLLQAGANADLKDSRGRRACDFAKESRLRGYLRKQGDQVAIERKLERTTSLPALVSKTPAAAEAKTSGVSRLRLDGLPKRHTSDHLEELICAMLEGYSIAAPSHVQVEVDPITLRPRGYAYLEFACTKRAELAERTLLERSSVSVSREMPSLAAAR